MPAILSKPAPSLSARLGPHAFPIAFSCAIFAYFYRRRKRFIKNLTRSESQRSLTDLETLKRVEDKKVGGKARTRTSSKDMIAVLKLALGKREIMNVVLLTLGLLGRTYMTLWIANSFGQSMKHLCDKNWRKLFHGTRQFVSWTLIAAIINGYLKYQQNTLALNVRQRLTHTAHTLYMERMNYYTANKVGNDKFENADQLIAEDVNKFADELADCYSNALKPSVDLVMFTWDLHRSMGAMGPLGMYGWFAISAYISTAVLPPYARLFTQEQLLEGRFRTAHANLIQNGEMIAFLRGERPELAVLEKAYNNIRKHVLSVLEMKFPCDVIQGYVNKYLASSVGFYLVIRPILLNHDGKGSMSPSEIAKYFVMRRQILEGLATSVLALFELQKKLGSLKGLGTRLNHLFTGLQRRQPILTEQIAKYSPIHPPQFVNGATLKFEHVSVFRPDGALLIHDLNMEVKAGDRVMITGNNGCGKSSLFRVLCRLWPLVCGTITTPPPKDVFFLSQVNFVPIGTLRELVTYPQSRAEMDAAGRSDDDVLNALRWAHLQDLECFNVRPTLDDTLEWTTALSPGQKQRMGFARLLYHKPRYAVLDECTNGISPDVEEDLYNRCHRLGMAIFSISHKIELKQLHDWELHILADSEGGYELTKIERKQ